MYITAMITPEEIQEALGDYFKKLDKLDDKKWSLDPTEVKFELDGQKTIMLSDVGMINVTLQTVSS